MSRARAHNPSLRAQAGFEFLTLAFLLTIFFTIVMLSYNLSRSQYQHRNIETQMKIVERTAAYAIATAAIEGDGFSTKINLPDRVYGYNYTINTSGSVLYIYLLGTEFAHSTPLLTPNVSGNFSTGENTVSNSGGLILVG